VNQPLISPSIRALGATVLWVVVAAASAQAQPAAFPSGTIRFVVPNSASTPPDIISRIIARELSEAEGWRVIVENRPGGVTTIAATDVLSQPADGHSLYAMSVPAAAAPSLVPKISYHFDTDFEPVIKASVSYNVLVVNPSVPANTVAELVALLKSQPDKLTFSSGGFGTPAHLIGEQFKLETGVRAQHVPYQQFPQAIGDLLNGTNAFMFITMLPVVDLIKTGKLRALAVTGPKRVPALSEVPTIVEAGFPSLVVEDWTGFAVKRGTPREVVAQLNAAINKALAKPSVREAFAKLGAETVGGTPEEYGALVKEQVAHWKKVLTDANIKVAQ
jgi:tripartite-type tricarboxylate transporter receptor subunit TctC